MLKLNSENPTLAILEPTFNAVLDRFIEEERLLEIRQRRPGDLCDEGELSYSTAVSYLSVIKQVRAKWGGTHITRMKPVQVQDWLKKMDAAPKTKGHVKAIMHRLYEKAMLWEMVEWQRNPMELVEVKGISKRQKKPVVLTVEQFYLIVALLPEPCRTMVMVAQCTGLRAEEVLALEWQDIDFENLSMRICPGCRSRSGQDGEDGVLGRRTAARSRFRGNSSGMEDAVREGSQIGRKNPVYWVEAGLYESGYRTSLPYGSPSAGLHPACWMLPDGVPEVRCKFRCLVHDR